MAKIFGGTGNPPRNAIIIIITMKSYTADLRRLVKKNVEML